MIPGLQERLMDASTEQIAHIGELVSHTIYSQLVISFALDTEGLRQCKVGRYEELENCYP
jgi:hypothetical protein